MTQHDALLAAVCSAPDDDLPRLVYADWCDENGQPERAEFIRTQIELTCETMRKKRAALQKREQELLAEHRAAWEKPLLKFTDNHFHEPFRFRRGFVEDISIDAETFLERGTKLFRLAPIRTLRMGDEDDLNDLSRCKHLLRVSSLELTGSRLGDEYHGSAKFFGSKVLANLTTLIAGGYDDNGHLDTAAFKALVRNKHLTNLRTLDISGNWLFNVPTAEHAEVTSLLMELGNLPALTELDLSAIWLLAPVIRELAGQRWMSRIRRLDLHRNHAGDDGGRALAESPHLAHIEHLDLRDNDGFDEEKGGSPMSDEVKRLLKRQFGERVIL